MTPKFDDLVNTLLNEARCKNPSLPQLSDKKKFRFMRCVENPYSSGIKRVYYMRKDGTFNYKKCNKVQRPGTEAGETCRYIRKMLKKRLS